MWKSRTVSTPVMDVFDEKGTPETRRVGCYEFVQFTRYWAAVGGGDGYGTPASSATVDLRIVDDRA